MSASSVAVRHSGEQAGAALPDATMFGRIVVASATAHTLTSLDRRRSASFVQVAECSACCGPPDHPALREHERDLLRVVVERLLAHGIRARGEQRVTVSGRASRHILDAVEESRGDLLIAAGQSGRFRSLSHRRLIARLLRVAPCPVFVLPLPPEARGRSAASAWLRLWRHGPNSQPVPPN